jgi:hypothetical protein
MIESPELTKMGTLTLKPVLHFAGFPLPETVSPL